MCQFREVPVRGLKFKLFLSLWWPLRLKTLAQRPHSPGYLLESRSQSRIPDFSDYSPGPGFHYESRSQSLSQIFGTGTAGSQKPCPRCRPLFMMMSLRSKSDTLPDSFNTLIKVHSIVLSFYSKAFHFLFKKALARWTETDDPENDAIVIDYSN